MQKLFFNLVVENSEFWAMLVIVIWAFLVSRHTPY